MPANLVESEKNGVQRQGVNKIESAQQDIEELENAMGNDMDDEYNNDDHQV